MKKIMKRVLGDPEIKTLKRMRKRVAEINELEDKYKDMSDTDLANMTNVLRTTLDEKGQTLDTILPDAFAVVREVADRILKQRHYEVQLIGGMVLHEGTVAEMKTGEGKTLVATLPMFLNALEGKGAHLVTVNDYLARIGTGWMGPVYHFLGLRKPMRLISPMVQTTNLASITCATTWCVKSSNCASVSSTMQLLMRLTPY